MSRNFIRRLETSKTEHVLLCTCRFMMVSAVLRWPFACGIHEKRTTDAAHILPILFPFSTPAKFCVRAIARFVQRVTDMKKAPPVISLVTPATTTSSSPTLVPLRGSAKLGWWSDSSLSEPTSPKRFNAQEQSLAKQKRRKTTSLSHAAVKLGSRTAHIFQFGSEEVSVGGTIPSNLLNDERLGVKIGNEHVYAGDHMVYNEWVGYRFFRLGIVA